MGLLDGLLGQVLGGALGQPDAGTTSSAPTRGMPGGMGGLGGMAGSALVAILLQIVQQNGGLGGLLSRFRQAGYQEQADSWVSTGRNQPIDGDDLSKVLGAGEIDRIAERLGVPRHEAADQVASALPEVVDRMTPRGELPSDSDALVNRALEMLQQGRR